MAEAAGRGESDRETADNEQRTGTVGQTK
eukprot:SAG31_NODE_14831_length_785_cov_1.320700_2_plen_28_part_01